MFRSLPKRTRPLFHTGLTESRTVFHNTTFFGTAFGTDAPSSGFPGMPAGCSEQIAGQTRSFRQEYFLPICRFPQSASGRSAFLRSPFRLHVAGLLPFPVPDGRSSAESFTRRPPSAQTALPVFPRAAIRGNKKRKQLLKILFNPFWRTAPPISFFPETMLTLLRQVATKKSLRG